MLYHICALTDWGAAQTEGEYRADSLATEGFIHCSLARQVLATANRFYRGRQGLVLLAIDTDHLTAEVRSEAADGDQFPHVYGPILLAAVVSVFPFVPGADGMFTQASIEGSFDA
jgi:uncharacterized protein (DUF952 family)